MSNSSDHAIRPLLFFPIVAALVIVVVVAVIKIVPGRTPPPEVATNEPPPVRSDPPIISADKRPPPANEISPANAEPEDPAPPVPDSVSPTDEQEDPAADAVAPTEAARPSEPSAQSDAKEPAANFCEGQGWRLGPVRIATGIFGFRTVGADGPRYAVAAPLDQLYLSLTVIFTRSDETAGAIVIVPLDDLSPTLTLLSGGEHYLPVGVVREDARPWAPFDASAVPIESGSSEELTLAYLVPGALSRVVVAIEGVSCGELELPEAEPLAIHELPGYWVKSPEMISSLRFENAIADAIASRERLLLHFEPAGVDTVRAEFPGPGIAGTPLKRSPLAHSGAFELQWGEHASPAWVRTTDGGRRVLLYVGEPSGPVFVFEPAE